MLSLRTLDVRWMRRYRLFYLAGIAIMSIQIFLAVIFFTLYEETDKNADEAGIPNAIRLDKEVQSRLSENEGAHANRIRITVNSKGKIHQNRDKAKSENSSMNKFAIETFGSSTLCNVSKREAVSAVTRARTSYCKQLIVNTTCLMQRNQLFPAHLPHSCPNFGLTYGKYVGCFRDTSSTRLLTGAYYNSSKTNSQTYCINRCLHAGFSYAGVQFANECFCGNEEPTMKKRLPESFCDSKCPSNSSQSCGGYYTTNVFETGVAKFSAQTENAASTSDTNQSNPPARIVFLLTLSGRDVRQVYRLIRVLYQRNHFFFLHVDSRQDYMFRELLPLELKLSNVRLSRRRHSTIWGGASLLTMLLQSMSEVIQSSWDWDYLINLSESDFPIKSTKELTAFLSANRNRNFVKSHGRDVHHFISKQGLDKTFVECDEHMWRIGNRMLPTGIVIDGGSDWISLSRPFVNYLVTAENDKLLDGLKALYKHTLLPAESFFHTVLRNSMFCDTYMDNNLHVTNWKRHLGCKCQYKHVVDWCGCSPNVFTMDDWSRIQSAENKSLFFARKFDPVICQSIIDRIESWLNDRSSTHFNSQRRHWLNVYHHLDRKSIVEQAVVEVGSVLSRRMLNYMVKNDLMCLRLKFRKLLQVFAFFKDDLQEGILVHFEAVSANKTSVQFETWYKIEYSFKLYNFSKFSTRFIYLQVSTNYDLKEKISRNFAFVVGPTSEPVLIYKVTSGAAVSNISVLWLDPTQTLVDIGEISVDESADTYHSKPNLKTPLLSGEWEVYLVHNSVVLARATFIVVPLNQASQDIRESANPPTDWNSLLPVIKLIKDDYDPETRKEKLRKARTYSETERIDWIDSLTWKSYSVQEFCVVNEVVPDSAPTCYQHNVPHCSSSFWSSFSPDPKIHIATVNKMTGRLN